MQQAERAQRLRIGELASELGLNPKTIRYYEDIGLLPSPGRTPGGYRQYDETDRERLGFILKAKAIGLSLEEIGEILALRRNGKQPCEHVLTLLDRKIDAIDQQLRALEDVRQELVDLRQAAVETIGTEARICRIIEHHESARQEVQRGEGVSHRRVS